MYSIGLDVSKASLSIHVPLNSLDFEIKNTLKDLRRLKNFEVFEGEGGVATQLAEDLSLEEIENIIEGIN